MLIDTRGGISLEASLVLPLLLAFIGVMIVLDIDVFQFVKEYALCDIAIETDYCNTHRAVSAVFDSGGNIYEILFG